MKKIIATTLLTITFAATAEASCFGTKAFMTCSDGNSYSTIGNTTFGSNSNTGSSWSQTTIGNTLTALPALGRAGTAITTVQAAGVPTAEVIPGAALELSATTHWQSYQLLVGLGLRLAPFFLMLLIVGCQNWRLTYEKVWFACLYCLLFFPTGMVPAEDNCQFSGKFADLSESRKIQVLNCPVGQTWYSDALTDEDRFALIRMAISSHPTTEFLSILSSLNQVKMRFQFWNSL